MIDNIPTSSTQVIQNLSTVYCKGSGFVGHLLTCKGSATELSDAISETGEKIRGTYELKSSHPTRAETDQIAAASTGAIHDVLQV